MQTDGNASGEDEKNYESPVSPSQTNTSLAETPNINLLGKHPSETTIDGNFVANNYEALKRFMTLKNSIDHLGLQITRCTKALDELLTAHLEQLEADQEKVAAAAAANSKPQPQGTSQQKRKTPTTIDDEGFITPGRRRTKKSTTTATPNPAPDSATSTTEKNARVFIRPLPPPQIAQDRKPHPLLTKNKPLDESTYEFLTILLRLARDNSLNADGIFAVVIDLIPELETLKIKILTSKEPRSSKGIQGDTASKLFSPRAINLHSLRFGSWNSNGLIKHLNEVIEFVSDHDLDLFLIQETCLQPGREPNIPNFTLYKNDRINFTNFRSSGGTCIYVKNSFNHYQLPTQQMTGIEATIINLQVTDNTKIAFASIYCKNSAIFPINDLNNLLNIQPHVIVAGDFNARYTSWNNTSNHTRGISLKKYINSKPKTKIIAPTEYTTLILKILRTTLSLISRSIKIFRFRLPRQSNTN
ncbi:putative RNA-directed DNA polymerase from transposon X-element [Caerostris extrusa]|uniref:RNA-directed DNA polymerase from transposon X-element n=1 Tax=Caerostris extrusa TaxID=172846 RepID=A0AAV4RFN3_CAEEX|nr:putative RNA-directed DNA polymerase from transposon X-element [Caerostris extrusa]